MVKTAQTSLPAFCSSVVCGPINSGRLRDGGHEVFVQWVFPKQALPACDTAKDVEVDAQARLTGEGNREQSGRDVLNIENTSTVVKLKGSSSDGGVENFKVQVGTINRALIACSDFKAGAF